VILVILGPLAMASGDLTLVDIGSLIPELQRFLDFDFDNDNDFGPGSTGS
jgi:hypothetical protein